MPEVESFHESAERCFELAKSSGFLKSSDFLEEDIAVEAFELLIANDCDPILAHAMGVRL